MIQCVFCQQRLERVDEPCPRCHGIQPSSQRLVEEQATQRLTIRCPNCGSITPTSAHFCGHCGTPLKSPPILHSTPILHTTPAQPASHPNAQIDTSHRSCPRCQKAVPPQAHLCSACGYLLGPQQDVHTPKDATVNPSPTSHLQNTSMPASTPFNSVQHSQSTEAPTPIGKNGVPLPEDDLQKIDGSDKREKGVLATFNEARLQWHKLSPPSRLILGFTLVQILLVGLFLLAQNNLGFSVPSGAVDDQGELYVVPLATFFVMAISFGFGYWFILAGALKVHWIVRFLLIALITGLLAINPIASLFALSGVNTPEMVLISMQLGTLAILWIWALYITLHKHPLRNFSVWVVLAFLLIYYALDFGSWLLYARVGRAALGSNFLFQSFGIQTVFLSFFFILLTLWFSTEYLEWGDIIARDSIARISSRLPASLPWLLPFMTVLVAIATIVYVLLLDGGNSLLELAVISVLIGIIIPILLFAQAGSDWPLPEDIPRSAVFLGAVFLFAYLALPSDIVESIVSSPQLPLDPTVFSLFSLLGLPVALLALTAGLVLVAGSRIGKPSQAVVGLFLLITALIALTVELPTTLSALNFHVAYPQQHFALLHGIQLFAALATLAWMLYLRVGKRSSLAEAAKPLFLLLVGLLLISLIHELLQLISAAGNSVFWLAFLFLLTTLWDFFTPGDQVNKNADEQLHNTDDTNFPRSGRILLSAGYTLVSTATLLYLGSLRLPTTPQHAIASAPGFSINTDSIGLSGLSLLGISLVVLYFIKRNAGPQSRTASTAFLSGTQWKIAGSGLLVTIPLTIFALSFALPQFVSINASQQAQYTALIPGPGCDSGNALWSVTPGGPITTQCLPKRGLQVKGVPLKVGRVVFSHSPFAHNYSVSMSINFRGFKGCAGFGTRFSAAGEYQNFICTDGSWFINRFSRQQKSLAFGAVRPASVYTITAISDDAHQRLNINGVQVASVSDHTLNSDRLDLALYNTGTANASAIFSNFVYTPLP